MMDESFLTTEEVLEYLQVNLRTVYRLIKAGKIPAVRVGRQWRFRKRDIDAWLETQRPRGARAAAASRGIVSPPERPRVLIVDDEATIRDLLSKTLALAEYAVDLASDGRRALRAPPLGRHPRSKAAEGRHPGHHHHGLLHGGQRHRGRQPWRVGVSHEAVP